jgi:DNA-binding response OmpR family regulator
VILDLGLPGVDGFEVARQLRRSTAGASVPLIALSAYDSPAHRQRTREVGFDQHLAKPPNWPQLHALIIAYGIKVHRARGVSARLSDLAPVGGP